jgi:hypothetical protein
MRNSVRSTWKGYVPYFLSCSPLTPLLQNRELLQTLGLYKPQIEPKPKEKREKVTKKRKTENEDNDESKVQRIAVEGVRRSARNAGKTIDYNSEIQRSLPKPLTRKSENEGPQGRDGDSKRIHDPFEPFELVDMHCALTFLIIAKHLGIFLALRSVLGGSQGRVAAQMLFTRKVLLISKMARLFTSHSIGHGSQASLAVGRVHTALP